MADGTDDRRQPQRDKQRLANQHHDVITITWDTGGLILNWAATNPSATPYRYPAGDPEVVAIQTILVGARDERTYCACAQLTMSVHRVRGCRQHINHSAIDMTIIGCRGMLRRQTQCSLPGEGRDSVEETSAAAEGTGLQTVCVSGVTAAPHIRLSLFPRNILIAGYLAKHELLCAA